jgi:hypothetical protein
LCAIVIRRFSLNEAPLGLYEFISDYFPYSDNHKFHQYQENDYLSSSLNLSRRDCMAVEFTTTCAIVAVHWRFGV